MGEVKLKWWHWAGIALMIALGGVFAWFKLQKKYNDDDLLKAEKALSEIKNNGKTSVIITDSIKAALEDIFEAGQGWTDAQLNLLK
jgi:hypothetical protein